MRIEFLTQDDPVYVFPFFDEFLRTYAEEFTVVQISCSPPMGKRPRLQLLRELTALYGYLGVARLLGRTASARALGKVRRPRNSRRFYSIEQIANAYGIPFSRIGNPNAEEFVQSVRTRAADLIVSVACPYILKDKILSVSNHGCINIHHAPLPRYKGMMPTFWQMYHGESQVGVTVHYMAAKVDEGAVLLQEKLQVENGETLDELIRRSKRHGAHCVAKVLREISVGKQQVIEHRQERGSYFTFPNLREIREFHRKGYRAL